MDNGKTDNNKKRLNEMIKKFSYLKNIDKNFKIFGASFHKYEFGKLLGENTVNDFEKKYNVKIPFEYKLFMLEIGNGGAGPFYGIVPFEKCLFSDIDHPNDKYLLNPSIPFPYNDEWTMKFDGNYEEGNEEAIEEFEKEYFDDKHIAGMIRICNFGCGHFINLVVNGYEYSNVWSDDRGSDYGIYPFNYYTFNNQKRLTFFDWYECWLDKSINEIEVGKSKNGT